MRMLIYFQVLLDTNLDKIDIWISILTLLKGVQNQHNHPSIKVLKINGRAKYRIEKTLSINIIEEVA